MIVAGLFENLLQTIRIPLQACGAGILGPIAKVIGGAPWNRRKNRHLFDNIRFYPGLAAVEETATAHEMGKVPLVLGGI